MSNYPGWRNCPEESGCEDKSGGEDRGDAFKAWATMRHSEYSRA